MIYNNNIDAIVEKATVEIKGAPSVAWLERVKTEYLGTNGIITRSIKSAETLPTSVKEERIADLQRAKTKLERLISKRTKELKMVK